MAAQSAVILDALLRTLVLLAALAAAAVFLTHWAVRAGHLPPFNGWATFVRRWSDPLLKPIEQRLVRAGRNPQEAPGWLLGLVIVAGILLLSLTAWLVSFVYTLAALRHAGPRGALLFLVDMVFKVLLVALIVRVIASWFGAGRYNKFTRWTYRLTDWLVEPIRRRLPAFGMLDLSPLIAYVVLILLRSLVVALL